MRAVRTALMVVAGFVLLQVVFFVLLVGGAAVPDSAVARSLARDVAAGAYGPSGMKDRMGGGADTFTECVVAGTGLSAPDLGVLDRAALMPRLDSCKGGATQIRALARGEQVDGFVPYFRYWAGYTVLTKPLIAMFGLTGLRVLVGAALVAALGWVVWAVRRTVSTGAALALVAPLVVASNVMSTPSTSVSHAITISTYLACAGATALAAARSLNWGLIAVGASAAIFCFIDLLTTPAAGWMLSTAVLAGVTWVRTAGLRQTLQAVVLGGIIWPVAFGATWFTRWLIAVPAAGVDVVRRDVVDKVLFRTSGEYPGVRAGLGAATSVNVQYWVNHVATARATSVGVSVVIVVAVGLIMRQRRRTRVGVLPTLAAGALIACPAALGALWYEALSNHSQIHEFFTDRNLPVSLGVLAFAALAALEGARRAGNAITRSDAPKEPGRSEPGQEEDLFVTS